MTNTRDLPHHWSSRVRYNKPISQEQKSILVEALNNRGVVAPTPAGHDEEDYWDAIWDLKKRGLVERDGLATNNTEYNRDGWRFVIA